MPDAATDTDALLRVVVAANRYRRARSDQNRKPIPQEYWGELCDALDALSIAGAKSEIERLRSVAELC